MAGETYQIRQCPSCGLRYPLTDNHSFGDRCPNCLGFTKIVLTHHIAPHPTPVSIDRTIELEALLDNIRSAWNVGAIFRTADGLGVRKLHLCGITPTPKNEAVRKTSLGAEGTIAWEYSRNSLETAKRLKSENCKLIALEQDARAIELGDRSNLNLAQDDRLVLILGNEVTGVDPDILDLCDTILHILMKGSKRSLNVEVAFGIAAFQLFRK
jgi:23S rRNA (guanosine2251-2'-O)-methyltransferase